MAKQVKQRRELARRIAAINSEIDQEESGYQYMDSSDYIGVLDAQRLELKQRIAEIDKQIN